MTFVDADQQLLEAIRLPDRVAAPAIESAEQALRERYVSTPGLADRIITATWQEVEHDSEIDRTRAALHQAMGAVDIGIGSIRKTLDALTRLYDVEIAEGDTAAIDAAVTGLRVNLAALRHLTRNAAPETTQ